MTHGHAFWALILGPILAAFIIFMIVEQVAITRNKKRGDR